MNSSEREKKNVSEPIYLSVTEFCFNFHEILEHKLKSATGLKPQERCRGLTLGLCIYYVDQFLDLESDNFP